jgi:hypothetical protein
VSLGGQIEVTIVKIKNKVRTFVFLLDIDRHKLWEVKICRKSWKASDGGRICKVITFPL